MPAPGVDADCPLEGSGKARYLAAVARCVGDGARAWRARVELFALDDSAARVTASMRSLGRLLPADDGQRLSALHSLEHAVDLGIGDAARPVVGFVFWVRSNDLGLAAHTAVEFARTVGDGLGVGPRLYTVSVIPAEAVPPGVQEPYPEPET